MNSIASPLSTRERILDAAERLFATRGIARTSVRMIVEAAGANLGAINYHFGSKHAVLCEVFNRVSAPISKERQERLAALEAGHPGGPHDLAEILRALYWPVFRRFVGPERATEWNALSIIVQLRTDPSDTATSILENHENSFAPEFDRAFAAALALEGQRLHRAICMVNSTVWDLVGHPIMLQNIRRDAAGNADLQILFEQFIAFGVGGLRAACVGGTGDTR